jgi:hypothetical protein
MQNTGLVFNAIGLKNTITWENRTTYFSCATFEEKQILF